MNKRFGRYTVTLTHTDKPLIGTYTKGDLTEYYSQIAPQMIPYLKNHPLMMHRFPEGISGESFYQKDASEYFPEWIKTIPITKKDGKYHAVVCQNEATLIYLANQGCITPHLWLSSIDNLTHPDRLIFDFDPSGDTFSDVQFLALRLKELLDTLGITSFVMTSGSRGLHIYIPLRRGPDFAQTRAFAQQCAQFLVAHHPEKATLEIKKNRRSDKVFIDTLRNQWGATSVAPYAVRALQGAPVATPLFWHEVEDTKLHPQKYTMKNLFQRLSQQEDPWADFFSTKQSLINATRKLNESSLPQ